MKNVIILGSSHTEGQCWKNGEDTRIPVESLWCGILSKKLNRNLIRLGHCGIENYQLTHFLLSYKKDNPDVIKNTDLVIVEARMGSRKTPLPIEQYGDHMLPDYTELPVYHSTIDYREHPHSKTHIDAYDKPYDNPESFDKLSKKLTDFEKREAETIRTVGRLTRRTLYGYETSFLELVVMKELCDNWGIPNFAWYTFAQTYLPTFKSPHVSKMKQTLSTLYPDIAKYNLLDHDLRMLLPHHFKNTTCDCGHLDEHAQQDIANELYLGINNKLELI